MAAARQSDHPDLIARVALPVPLPQTFDYLSAGFPVYPGCRVRVPFGRTRRTGVVIDTSAEPDLVVERIKPIEAVLDAEPLFDNELFANLRRGAEYWCGALGEVLFGALPSPLREGRAPAEFAEEIWRATAAGASARDARTRRGGSAALLETLGDEAVSASELDTLLPGWRAAARRLATAGLIERAQSAAHPPRARDAAVPLLNDEQADALAAILCAGGGFRPFLLQGITGSGKTEIYLRLTEQALRAGKQALWLVPEIGLVPQALRRLRARFDARIAVLHSNLAEGERARAWLDARSSAAAIVLGTRSAVFAPLPHAGLIVVDEEHDASYKQQEGFRYRARFRVDARASIGGGDRTGQRHTLAGDAGQCRGGSLHAPAPAPSRARAATLTRARAGPARLDARARPVARVAGRPGCVRRAWRAGIGVQEPSWLC